MPKSASSRRYRWQSGLVPLLVVLLAAAGPGGAARPLHAQGGSIPEGTPFLTLSAIDFVASSGVGALSNGRSRYCANSFCTFVRAIDLPHGVSIIGMELDACDNDAFNSWRFTVRRHEVNELGSTSALTHTTGVTMGPCQFFVHVPALPHYVDQFGATYSVEVSAYEAIDGDDNPTTSLRFQAVRLYLEPGSGSVIPSGGSFGIVE